MPLFYHSKQAECEVAIWKVEETLDELLDMILPSQPEIENQLTQFSSNARKVEWLAVRVLLRKVTQKDYKVIYNDEGKPFLDDSPLTISISHTKGYVSIILAEQNAAIDIECYGKKAERVAKRFVREDEVIDYEPSFDKYWNLVLFWSAKESLFKFMSTTEVDFKEHMQIHPFCLKSEGNFFISQYRKSPHTKHKVTYKIFEDFVLTYLCDK